MTKVSISEAARLAGVSRQTLYRKIDAGEITVERDGDSVQIDLSELLRVFGDLKMPGTPDSCSEPEPAAVVADRSAEVDLLRDQLAEAREREEWHRKHADELAGVLKLLEDKSRAVLQADSALIAELRKRVEQLEGELTESRKINKDLREALATERGRGIFARLTGRTSVLHGA